MASQTVNFVNPTVISNLNSDVTDLYRYNNGLKTSPFTPGHQARVADILFKICTGGSQPFAGSSAGTYKGMFAMYGNYFSGEDYFASTGVAGPDGRQYTEDTFCNWASMGKYAALMAMAKLLEEGWTTTDELCYKYIPEFTGAVPYYTTVFASPAQAAAKGYSGAFDKYFTGPAATGWAGQYGPGSTLTNFDNINPANPGSYIYKTSTFNLQTITSSTFINFNWPMLYPYLIYGLYAQLWMYSESNFATQSTFYVSLNPSNFPGQTNQTMGAAGALSWYKLRDFYFISGSGANQTIYPDCFYQVLGNTDGGSGAPTATNEDTFRTWLKLMKDGILPAMWAPGTRQIDNFFYGVETVPQVYGCSDEMLGWYISRVLSSSNNLRGYAYTGGAQAYIHDKILTPLGIPNSVTEVPFWSLNTGAVYPAPDTVSLQFRRAPALCITGPGYPLGCGYATGSDLVSITGPLPGGLSGCLGQSWGCDPNYIADGRVGETVFVDQYNYWADNLGNCLNKLAKSGNGGDVILGGAVWTYMRPKYQRRLYGLLARRGFTADGVQVFKPLTVDWLLANHASALSIMYFNPQAIGGQINDDIYMAYNGGLTRFNTDLCASVYYGANPNIRYWGGAFSVKGFVDIHNGNYLTAGTHMFVACSTPTTWVKSDTISKTGNSYANWRTIYCCLDMFAAACK